MKNNTIRIYYITPVIFIIYIILNYLTHELIYGESIYFKSYNKIYNEELIRGVVDFNSRFSWLVYLIVPIIYGLKFIFNSLCINIGKILSEKDIQYGAIIKSVVAAEIVFIIAEIIYVYILFKYINEITLQNVSGYFPLSALSFIGIENVHAQWAIYPLQTANLFQVFYVVTIAWLLSKQWKQNFVESLNVVLPSYGLGLLLWVTLVAFLTLQIS